MDSFTMPMMSHMNELTEIDSDVNDDSSRLRHL